MTLGELIRQAWALAKEHGTETEVVVEGIPDVTEDYRYWTGDFTEGHRPVLSVIKVPALDRDGSEKGCCIEDDAECGGHPTVKFIALGREIEEYDPRDVYASGSNDG